MAPTWLLLQKAYRLLVIRPTFSRHLASMASQAQISTRFIDVGVNLTDKMFRGSYRGHRKHADDFTSMLQRAKAAGVHSQIITGGSLAESKEAHDMAKEHGFYSTAGCHPTRSKELARLPTGQYIHQLDEFITQNMKGPSRIVAIGECGLDYDRLFFADKNSQKMAFRAQLTLAKKHHLPLFLHSRNCQQDFVNLLTEAGMHENGGEAVGGKGGVVHSFTGTTEEMQEMVNMGYYISLNGCSMKTAEQLEMVKTVPLERLMLETDAPWCSLTGGHASKDILASLPPKYRSLYFPPAVPPERFQVGKAVKGRNEPCAIGAVAYVVARLKGVLIQEVAEHAWRNTVNCFGLTELEDPTAEQAESSTPA